MAVECPGCGTTKDHGAEMVTMAMNGYTTAEVGLHIYEYADNPNDIIWSCAECGCHFRGDGRRVSMLGHILGPNPTHRELNLTGVKKR